MRKDEYQYRAVNEFRRGTMSERLNSCAQCESAWREQPPAADVRRNPLEVPAILSQPLLQDGAAAMSVCLPGFRLVSLAKVACLTLLLVIGMSLPADAGHHGWGGHYGGFYGGGHYGGYGWGGYHSGWGGYGLGGYRGMGGYYGYGWPGYGVGYRGVSIGIGSPAYYGYGYPGFYSASFGSGYYGGWGYSRPWGYRYGIGYRGASWGYPATYGVYGSPYLTAYSPYRAWGYQTWPGTYSSYSLPYGYGYSGAVIPVSSGGVVRYGNVSSPSLITPTVTTVGYMGTGYSAVPYATYGYGTVQGTSCASCGSYGYRSWGW